MGNISVEPRTAKTVKLDSSSNNIPTTFSTAAGSLVLTGISSAQNLIVANGISTGLVLNIEGGDPTSAPSADNIRIPASSTAVLNNIKLTSCIYVRSDGSTLSSGVVAFSVY